MKINFKQAQLIMGFILKAEEEFNAERPLSYQYMLGMMKNANIDDLLEHITRVMRQKPEVYERALCDLKQRLSQNLLEKAGTKYAEFEKYYNINTQEESFVL